MTNLTQTRICVSLGKELVHDLHQTIMPLTGAILQEEVKAVGHAQFRNGRQLEHIPLRVLKSR